MRAYGAKNSDRQIKNSPIPTKTNSPNLMLAKSVSRYTVLYERLEVHVLNHSRDRVVYINLSKMINSADNH